MLRQILEELSHCSLQMGLEALQPHQRLKGLTVSFYRGVGTPSWLPLLTHLVYICFNTCEWIQRLPSFDHLPYLKDFRLFTLTNLESVDVAFASENGRFLPFFPSLTNLSLTNCPNLKGFVRCSSGVGMNPSSSFMEQLPYFPRVSTLEIGNCLNINHMPLFPDLKTLTLRKDGVKSLKQILNKATTLPQSTSSPFLVLSQLEKLYILEMENFPEDKLLQYLTSLQHLQIYSCKLKTVASDEKDGGVQWQCLKALTSTAFGYNENLVSIPKGLQYVSTLQSLRICGCCNLVCIPEWMTNLTSLQNLAIIDCPQLSERCNNNLAEDWHKISHIPYISINHRSIQRNGCYLL